MVEQLLAFIRDQRLFDRHNKLLFAVSGGVDSMVLTHMLKKLEFNFSMAHCNFSLRGHESDQDEEFIRSYAQTNTIECFCKRFDTKKYATDNKVSTQMAARELRYRWFEDLVAANKFDFILTAHHLNDSLETTIFNFTKGTGLSGLKGISIKNDRVVRPLLFAERKEIEEYAKENALQWREDSSNSSLKYHRNSIRHEVIPILKKINPLVEKTFINTARRVKESEQAVDLLLSTLEDKHIQNRNGITWIHKDALINALIIHKLIANYGFNYTQAIDIESSILNVGSIFVSDEYRINIDRDHIIIMAIKEENVEYLIKEGQGQASTNYFDLTFTNSEYDIKSIKTGKSATLDLDKLRFPLKIRKWELGDKFVPLGMTGKKKVSDFMIDAKIPLNLKSRVLVLLSDNEIAWVIGYRVDNRFKVTPRTKKMFNIIFKDHD